MSKNIVVTIHHIATIVSVTISGVLLKKQKRRNTTLIVFLILQCYALFKMIIAFLSKKQIYQKSYCKLENLFNSKKIKKYAITLLIVSSTAFKILVPFLVYEKKKKQFEKT